MSVDKLVDSIALDSDLGNIANAIRTKGGTNSPLVFPSDFISAINALQVFHAYSGSIANFTTASATNLLKLSVAIEPVQTGSGDPSPNNVRPISGWSDVNVWIQPTYDTSETPTITVGLNDTRYGGTLDVLSGLLTVDRVKISLAPNIIGTWFDNDISRNTLGFYLQSYDFNYRYPTPGIGQASGTVGLGMFEQYKKASAYANDNPYVAQLLFVNGSFNRFEARVPKSELGPFSTYAESRTAVINYLTSNPIVMCYEIATPILVQLSPTTISTLAGTNNVWADAGDITLWYAE